MGGFPPDGDMNVNEIEWEGRNTRKEGKEGREERDRCEVGRTETSTL